MIGYIALPENSNQWGSTLYSCERTRDEAVVECLIAGDRSAEQVVSDMDGPGTVAGYIDCGAMSATEADALVLDEDSEAVLEIDQADLADAWERIVEQAREER